MINEHKFKLDLKRRAGFFAIDLVESDTANRFDITLLDNGNPIDLTNHDVQAVFRRSDGKTIVQDSSNGCNINVAIAGTVTLSLLASSYRDGDNLCELQIIELAGGVSKTDSQITTARFVIRARKPLLNEDSINGSVEIPALHALIEALKDIRISITALDSESEATATFDYDEEGNIYSMSLGIPRGRNGIDGTDGRYVVRAYVEHEHLFIEMSDGELIDAGEVTDLERLEGLIEQKLDADGDGSAVTATRSMTYNFADIPTGEAITLAELLARLGGWYTQINSVSNELTNKLDKTGDASGASATYSTTTEFTSLPVREAIVFSRLLSILNGWYTQINSNIDAIQQLNTNKLDTNGDGSGVTVTPTSHTAVAFENFTLGEPITLHDTLVKLTAWYDKLNSIASGGMTGDIEELLANKLDIDGDGSAVTVMRSMFYDFADIPTGEAITLAELLARLGGWYTQIKEMYNDIADKLDKTGDGSAVTATPVDTIDKFSSFTPGESVSLSNVLERLNAWYTSIDGISNQIIDLSNELTNKLDKTGDASGASATYSTTTEFTSLPVREAIVFSRLLSILNGWYTQINSNIDAIQQLNTNKLDTNGDGSGVTVTPDLSVVQAFEEFAADETLPLEDVLARLNAWFSQIKVNSDSIETLALNKLNTDGDGSAVTATRSMTYNFADIPTGEAITLAELLARLGGWYAQINSVSNELTDKLDVADLEDATNAALQKAKESGEFNGADGKGIDTTTLNDDYTLTINYTDGTSYTTGNIRGAQGVQGNPGENGADGYTPVKGVDYYTAADKTEMVELVLAALPAAEGVSY